MEELVINKPLSTINREIRLSNEIKLQYPLYYLRGTYFKEATHELFGNRARNLPPQRAKIPYPPSIDSLGRQGI